MKKLINAVDQVENQMISGMVKAYPYIGMGAAILIALKPLMNCLSEMGASPAFWWLIGGGASYIIGAVFYSLRKPYMHSVFHLFCLGGSVGHIIAIWMVL